MCLYLSLLQLGTAFLGKVWARLEPASPVTTPVMSPFLLQHLSLKAKRAKVQDQ